MSITELKSCAECELDYPKEILASAKALMIEGSICGICALRVKNKIHGTYFKKFHGEKAEEMRQRALEWRNKRYGSRYFKRGKV